MFLKLLKNSVLPLFCLASCLTNLTSCSVYSLSGASVGDAKTVSVQNFLNESSGGPANLAQTFTEKLRLYMIQNTTLQLVNSGGDLQYEGSIVNYGLAPVGAGQGNIATQNRLNISMKCSFLNTKEEDKSFENQVFSFYYDFPSGQTLTAIENVAVENIANQIVFDIFTKSVANW